VGWIYAMWSPDGVLMDPGRADMCVGCHEADTSQSAFLAAGAM